MRMRRAWTALLWRHRPAGPNNIKLKTVRYAKLSPEENDD
jgi:hypothetical protein